MPVLVALPGFAIAIAGFHRFLDFLQILAQLLQTFRHFRFNTQVSVTVALLHPLGRLLLAHRELVLFGVRKSLGIFDDAPGCVDAKDRSCCCMSCCRS